MYMGCSFPAERKRNISLKLYKHLDLLDDEMLQLKFKMLLLLSTNSPACLYIILHWCSNLRTHQAQFRWSKARVSVTWYFLCVAVCFLAVSTVESVGWTYSVNESWSCFNKLVPHTSGLCSYCSMCVVHTPRDIYYLSSTATHCAFIFIYLFFCRWHICFLGHLTSKTRSF